MASMATTPKFYEMDGALRAYANRVAIVGIGLALAVVALVFNAVQVRDKPPVVIRVNADGRSVVINPDDNPRPTPALLAQVNAEEEPTPLERENFVITFVGQYMGYGEHTVTENWSNALSEMTSNLEQAVYQKMQQNNTVGQIQDQHIRSVVKITSAQPDASDPLVYHVYATRTVSRLSDRHETYQQLVEAYTVRLVEGKRSVEDPSGLMIAAFDPQEISATNAAPGS